MISRYFKPGIKTQRYIEGSDELGNPTKEWTDYLTISGVIDSVTGYESSIAGKSTVVSIPMLFCFPCDIREKDRVIYDSKVYEVTYVDDPMTFSRFLQVHLELKL